MEIVQIAETVGTAIEIMVHHRGREECLDLVLLARPPNAEGNSSCFAIKVSNDLLDLAPANPFDKLCRKITQLFLI